MYDIIKAQRIEDLEKAVNEIIDKKKAKPLGGPVYDPSAGGYYYLQAVTLPKKTTRRNK